MVLDSVVRVVTMIIDLDETHERRGLRLLVLAETGVTVHTGALVFDDVGPLVGAAGLGDANARIAAKRWGIGKDCAAGGLLRDGDNDVAKFEREGVGRHPCDGVY